MAGYFQKQLGVFATGKIVLKKSLLGSEFWGSFFCTRHPSWNFGKRDQTSEPWQVRRASRLIWQSIVHQQYPQCIPSHFTKTAQKKLILITIRNEFFLGSFSTRPIKSTEQRQNMFIFNLFLWYHCSISEKQFLLALIGIVLFHVAFQRARSCAGVVALFASKRFLTSVGEPVCL